MFKIIKTFYDVWMWMFYYYSCLLFSFFIIAISEESFFYHFYHFTNLKVFFIFNSSIEKLNKTNSYFESSDESLTLYTTPNDPDPKNFSVLYVLSPFLNSYFASFKSCRALFILLKNQINSNSNN